MAHDWAAYQPTEPEVVPEFFGSSEGFHVMIRRDYPHLVVPSDHVELLDTRGGQPHTPADEGLSQDEGDLVRSVRPQGGRCPKCWDEIRGGSLWYCPKCDGSGFEAQLAAQRQLAGFPPAEPTPAAIPLPAPRGATPEPLSTRRQRRAQRFGRDTAETPN